MKSSKSNALSGTIDVPGDKSISHRSLMLSAVAHGHSQIHGLLEGEDVLATSHALQALGVSLEKDQDVWHVQGAGFQALKAPTLELDMGNAGTGTRLMMGLLATCPFDVTFTGDQSLLSRPMGRIIRPLREMGVECVSEEERLPLTVCGNPQAQAIDYRLPVASAQVKSAVLLAGLNIKGKTCITEPVVSRDHTERMLTAMGADITVEDCGDQGRVITLVGGATLRAQEFLVPGDPSSAAFLVVAALITPGSEVLVCNVCLNPARTGLYDCLQEMGGDITITNKRDVAGEIVGDLSVRYSHLKAIKVNESRVSSMIDEYPILSVAAACAEGETVMTGLKELRVKESDRLAAIAQGLQAVGVDVDAKDDALSVRGADSIKGGSVKTHMDHRIAMAFLVMGLVSEEGVIIDDASMIDTSFPGFKRLINGLGAAVE